MTLTYTKIVAEARRRLSPRYFSVGVVFENSGAVTFRIALTLEDGDEMTHMHDIKGMELIEAIAEAVRRCNFDNGRVDAFEPVLIEAGNHGRSAALMPNSMYRHLDPLNTGN